MQSYLYCPPPPMVGTYKEMINVYWRQCVEKQKMLLDPKTCLNNILTDLHSLKKYLLSTHCVL